MPLCMYDVCACVFLCAHICMFTVVFVWESEDSLRSQSSTPTPLFKGVFLCCLVLCAPGWSAPWVSWESLVCTSVLPQDWDDRTHHCLALCGSWDFHPGLVFVWQVLYPLSHFPSAVCVCLLMGKFTHLHLTELLRLTFAILFYLFHVFWYFALHLLLYHFLLYLTGSFVVLFLFLIFL